MHVQSTSVLSESPLLKNIVDTAMIRTVISGFRGPLNNKYHLHQSPFSALQKPIEPTSLSSQRREEFGQSDDQHYAQYEPALPNLLHQSWRAHGSGVKYEGKSLPSGAYQLRAARYAPIQPLVQPQIVFSVLSQLC